MRLTPNQAEVLRRLPLNLVEWKTKVALATAKSLVRNDLVEQDVLGMIRPTAKGREALERTRRPASG